MCSNSFELRFKTQIVKFSATRSRYQLGKNPCCASQMNWGVSDLSSDDTLSIGWRLADSHQFSHRFPLLDQIQTALQKLKPWSLSLTSTAPAPPASITTSTSRSILLLLVHLLWLGDLQLTLWRKHTPTFNNLTSQTRREKKQWNILHTRCHRSKLLLD